jgi:hypothetical protein
MPSTARFAVDGIGAGAAWKPVWTVVSHHGVAVAGKPTNVFMTIG